MARFFQLAVLILVSTTWLQSATAQDVKIGNGRLLKKWRQDIFGANEKEQASAKKQQQPTPANPGQNAGPSRADSDSAALRQNPMGQIQPNSNVSGNQFRQPVAANQRLTPAQQQYQLRIEAQRRAEMLQRQQASQSPGPRSALPANTNVQPDYYRNRNAAPATSAAHRSGSPNTPQQYAPQPQAKLQANQFRTVPNASGSNRVQPSSSANSNAAQLNATRNAKRRGPPAVGFGMELKTDKHDKIYVADVERQGNADKVGIKKGDYLVGIGGAEIGTVEEFDEIVKVMSNGDQLELTLNRRGKEAEVMITFGELPEEDEGALEADPSSQFVQQPAAPNADLVEAFEFVPQTESPKQSPRGPVVNPDAFEIPTPPSQIPMSSSPDRPELPELELELQLPEMPSNESVLEKAKK